MKKINVKIKNGKITLETSGFEGPACIAEAEEIYRILKEAGVEIDLEKLEKKPEFYHAESVGTLYKV